VTGAPPAGAREAGARLEDDRQRIDSAMRTLADRAASEAAPVLQEAVRYALSTSGKRLRPILFLAAYRAVRAERGDDPALVRLACALEIVHTYSLVHDDLPCMDNDDLRRGRPTVHRVYGDAAAVLAGAALLPLAARLVEEEGALLGLPAAARGRLLGELCRAAGATGMVAGQLLDLECEERDVDGETLERIHRAKTGALLASALRLGAIAGGGTEESLAALSAYGAALGLAFQIMDDVLDVTGDSGTLGKTAGRDQDLKKASYPARYGVEGARALTATRVREAKEAIRRLESSELARLADYVLERRR
jgi:geranylgeranyl diphosphate synthase, type II